MDDKTLALPVAQEAAERLTAAGVLLECPLCGSESAIRTVGCSFWCPDCKASVSFPSYIGPEEALKRFNTRAPVLTPAQLALLRIGAEPRKFEEEKE